MSTKPAHSKGDSKHSGHGSHHGRHADEAPSDKTKLIKGIVGGVILVASVTWLIYYYDPFKLRKEDPGPAPDAYVEQLPKAEQERIEKQNKVAEETMTSTEEKPRISGQ